MLRTPILLWVAIAAVSSVLAGCETASAIVTGKTHSAIQPSEVKVYSAPPHAFEEVAIISAEASSGWTAQGQMDSAMANVKKKAAQLGANGLLIETSGTQSGATAVVPSGNSLLMIPSNVQAVKVRAIYVTQE